MERLETDLRLLAGASVYPPTPPIAAAVRRQVETLPWPRRRFAPAWGLSAVAAVLLAVVVAVAAIGPARDAVADLFGRIDIFRTSESPAGLPTDIEGTPLPLDEAQSQFGSKILTPTYPEGLELRRVLLQPYTGVRVVVLMYRLPGGPDIALFESDAIVRKGIPLVGASAVPVHGLGDEAYWLTGTRFVEYRNVKGYPVPESRREVEVNTLIWRSKSLVFRIEGNIARDEAIKIAGSLREP